MDLEKLSTELINNLLDQRIEINLLRKQVGRDSMTNLNNHQRFRELLQHELARSARYNYPLSLIFADIDDFKLINDTYGHLAGDRAIKIIAGCLKKELRQADHLAERLRETINSLSIAHGDDFIQITMSFGIVTLKPSENISLDESIRRADTALYKAKNQGRNQCCIFDIMN